MFKLICRISNGVILRPDRPWADDATSNAPTKGKKRRLERNADAEVAEEIRTKKIRGESDTPETKTPTPYPESQPESEPEPEPEHQKQEEKEVKEVTKGVEEVELNESRSTSKEVKPESVPLPGEDDAEELQEDVDAAPPLNAVSDHVSSSVTSEEEVDALPETEPKGQEVKADEEVREERAKDAEKETKKTETAPAELAR